MNILNCESCATEHDGSYGSGRFCSNKCARSYSTKVKRIEINNKVSISMTGKRHTESTKEKISLNNGSKRLEIREKISIGVKLSMTDQVKSKISKKLSGRVISDETKKKLSDISKKRCESIEERMRLQKIGRKGGFGKRGYTKNGTRFDSSLEEQCFIYLDDKIVNFTPHKPIPNTSKLSDIYLNDYNIWIELDGINRELRQKWLGKNYQYWLEKLELYRSNELNFKIIYNLNEFIEYINKITDL